ncbi:50S ribosomal protein L33 [Buchnera aphidicola (Chaitophorus populicola)]|uniref:50S ribosomal protein L33 n=1 Tax=Buchnera aphidicola TaxID=9 RepID=UPI003464C4B7
MAKSSRIKIKLISSLRTGHFYTTTKNKRNTVEKLKLIKYDPIARKRAVYTEFKLR